VGAFYYPTATARGGCRLSTADACASSHLQTVTLLFGQMYSPEHFSALVDTITRVTKIGSQVLWYATTTANADATFYVCAYPAQWNVVCARCVCVRVCTLRVCTLRVCVCACVRVSVRAVD
jgi:hypothetical protein